VAAGTVAGECRSAGREVAVVLGVRLPRPERHGMRRPRRSPGVHRRRVDMGVAGQGAAAVPLGAAGGRVGPCPRHDPRVKDDGAAGQLVRREARGRAIHRRGVQVLEVRRGPAAAIGHAVAGGAGDAVGEGGGVVGAQGMAAEGIVEVGGRADAGCHAVALGAVRRAVDAACRGPGRGGLAAVAADVAAGQGAGRERRRGCLAVEGAVDGDRRRSGGALGVGVVGRRP